MTTNPPNGWCVISGSPGKDPLTIIGPFVDEASAIAHVDKHRQENPTTPVMADILINPANC
jgi:hypothetical protein